MLAGSNMCMKYLDMKEDTNLGVSSTKFVSSYAFLQTHLIYSVVNGKSAMFLALLTDSVNCL